VRPVPQYWPARRTASSPPETGLAADFFNEIGA
jgi:hypothetical protein